MQKKTRVASFVLAALVVAAPALAGPPFNCHVFDIGSAKSLPWGALNNWLGTRDDYDVGRVVADTDKLLTPSTPVLVRMETLRRAVIYVSRDRAAAEQLVALVTGRVKAAEESGRQDAMAFFDAGFVVEAITELRDAGRFSKQLAGLDRILADVTGPANARALLEKSAALRPDDASIQFALGLISRTPESERHFAKARAAAGQDAMLANNLARLQLQ